MDTYNIPDDPTYSTSIRKLQNQDKVNAELVLNPLFSQMLENTHAVKLASDRLKADLTDKVRRVSLTIPISGWGSDSSVAAYSKYYDITVDGLTAEDWVEIAIAPDSLEAAKACGLCPTSQSLAGKIRVRATSFPATAIALECWIVNGKG